MKFCNNTNFTLPKQSKRSRSILQDGSRSLGCFGRKKTLSYNRRNTVLFQNMQSKLKSLDSQTSNACILFFKEHLFDSVRGVTKKKKHDPSNKHTLCLHVTISLK